jgi:hypothetical protein
MWMWSLSTPMGSTLRRQNCSTLVSPSPLMLATNGAKCSALRWHSQDAICRHTVPTRRQKNCHADRVL